MIGGGSRFCPPDLILLVWFFYLSLAWLIIYAIILGGRCRLGCSMKCGVIASRVVRWAFYFFSLFYSGLLLLPSLLFYVEYSYSISIYHYIYGIIYLDLLMIRPPSTLEPSKGNQSIMEPCRTANLGSVINHHPTKNDGNILLASRTCSNTSTLEATPPHPSTRC